MPKLPGLIKGLGVTGRTMFKKTVTVQYPHVKEAPATRARGVIAYEATEVAEMIGRSTVDLPLGLRRPVVHADDLVLRS